MAVALYAYFPTGMDPRELTVGAFDEIEVFGMPSPDWLMGRVVRTGQVGIVPATYCRAMMR